MPVTAVERYKTEVNKVINFFVNLTIINFPNDHDTNKECQEQIHKFRELEHKLIEGYAHYNKHNEHSFESDNYFDHMLNQLVNLQSLINLNAEQEEIDNKIKYLIQATAPNKMRETALSISAAISAAFLGSSAGFVVGGLTALTILMMLGAPTSLALMAYDAFYKTGLTWGFLSSFARITAFSSLSTGVITAVAGGHQIGKSAFYDTQQFFKQCEIWHKADKTLNGFFKPKKWVEIEKAMDITNVKDDKSATLKIDSSNTQPRLG